MRSCGWRRADTGMTCATPSRRSLRSTAWSRGWDLRSTTSRSRYGGAHRAEKRYFLPRPSGIISHHVGNFWALREKQEELPQVRDTESNLQVGKKLRTDQFPLVSGTKTQSRGIKMRFYQVNGWFGNTRHMRAKQISGQKVWGRLLQICSDSVWKRNWEKAQDKWGLAKTVKWKEGKVSRVRDEIIFQGECL